MVLWLHPKVFKRLTRRTLIADLYRLSGSGLDSNSYIVPGLGDAGDKFLYEAKEKLIHVRPLLNHVWRQALAGHNALVAFGALVLMPLILPAWILRALFTAVLAPSVPAGN